MNPIEHVWDALGRRVAGRQPPPQTLQELERALLKEKFESEKIKPINKNLSPKYSLHFTLSLMMAADGRFILLYLSWRQAPGGALSIKADRVVQTNISRLASGHIRGLSFHLGQKIYENCTKCNLVQATPDHLLFCAGLDREDIYSSPLLVYDFLGTLGLMDLV
ncbi:RNase H domain-containing protein [Trichonephila clavipes]|nr:RNase H domain-containing protein [Trichonephila clavipes]